MGCAEYEIAAHDDKAGKHDEWGRPCSIMLLRPDGGPNILPETKKQSDAEVHPSHRWLTFKNK